MCVCPWQNVVVYAGSAADREWIRDYEWDYPCDSGRAAKGKKGGKAERPRVKFTVLLTSYETVRQEDKLFQNRTAWATVIIDEAHRLKSTTAATRQAIASAVAGLTSYSALMDRSPPTCKIKCKLGQQ